MTASPSAPLPAPHPAPGVRPFSLAHGPTLRCIDRDPGGAAGAADTVLLLHGYSDSGRSWSPVVAALPPAWRVLAPDQRGHGDSDRPEDGYGIAQLAADAAALPRFATYVLHETLPPIVRLMLPPDLRNAEIRLEIRATDLDAVRAAAGRAELAALFEW